MNIVLDVSTFDFKNYKTDQFVIFDKKIVGTGSMDRLGSTLKSLDLTLEDCSITDGRGSFLIPGLIAGHTHLYSTFARGWLTPFSPESFQDILDQLWWKLDSKLGGDEVYYSGLSGAAEFLQNGVTTIIDHHASGNIIKGSLNRLKEAVVKEAGLRGLFCFETSDRFNIADCIEENISFDSELNESERNHCRGMFGMHASYTLSDDSLKKISEKIGDMPIHIHVAESKEDVDITYEKWGKTIIERLDDFGLLKPNSLIAHGVFITDREIEILKDRGCTIVFNPTSNMNNGVGLPPVKKAIDHKLPWIIGNDGIGYNVNRDYHNILFTYQLKHGSGSFPFNALQESINHSYKYVNTLLGCNIGEIQSGFDADLMLLPYNSITPVTKDNIMGHFFYGIMDSLNPSKLWTSGELRIKESKLLSPEKYKAKESRLCAGKLWEELNK